MNAFSTGANNILGGTEIIIDGVIYDIANFDHPGGETIKFFGGNDVSIQYKMIHPNHTKKSLKKLKPVGKVEGYESEYRFDSPFGREIKSEVFKIIHGGHGGYGFATKGFIFRASLYMVYFALMQYTFATCDKFFNYDVWYESGVFIAIMFGTAQALIGLNVQHDANHGSISKLPWVNSLLGFTTDLIGSSKWSWNAQHWAHHAYTNHQDKDPDYYASEPLFAFKDYPTNHPNRKWWYKFQGWYFMFGICFMWISNVFNPQVIDLRQRCAQFVGVQMENEYIVTRRKFAVALRAIYIYFNFYCPFVNNGWSLETFGIIMLMGVCESLVLTIPAVVSHNFVGTEQDPTADYRKTGQPICWYKSQVESSSTYGGAMSGYIAGGLNFQIEHHLFPRMNSAWYPYIAPKVQEICKKHGVKYTCYPSIWQSLLSTLTYIHEVGTGANWEKCARGA